MFLKDHYPYDDPNQLASFLWIFYNPKYSIYSTSVERWYCILELAEFWQFSGMVPFINEQIYNVKVTEAKEYDKVMEGIFNRQSTPPDPDEPLDDYTAWKYMPADTKAAIKAHWEDDHGP